MTLKIGINGFGRIGRLVARIAIKHPELELVGVNDLVPADNLAYLFKYDSTHGTYQGTVAAQPDGISIDNCFVPCLAIKDPAELPWGKLEADYVVESTGLFTTFEGAQKHIQAGAKRVVISAPSKDPDKIRTLVMGVNHQEFDPATDEIVSNASCTTNCLAPVAKVLHDTFGIAEGLMTTIHAMTPTQLTVDGPSKKDWRSGRGASQNIIPASTGAAKAVALVLPDLKGKLTGMAFRVGTADVSVIDLTFKTVKPTTYADICTAMKAAAAGELNGILGYTEDKVVSMDFRTDPRSSIFDATAGIGLNANFFKVVAWYDNEWAYACRTLDLMLFMARKDGLI
jgi:glyceraldehyde 3-phosphate dehydrogenase